MKNKQGLTIAALIVAIVGLSIGFAAFSNTLQISSSASVNPSENTFNVVFSRSSNSISTTSLQPTLNAAATSANISTTSATLDGRTLSGLSAAFTAPGQSVTYSTELYVYNAGQLQAQLTGIIFNNATNAAVGETYKHCYAKTTNVPAAEQATPTLVAAACEGISISVTVGTANDVTPTSTGNLAALNYQLINAGASLPVSVTISYDAGSAYVDGPMEVEFGTIQISATSAVNPSLVVPSSPSSPSEPAQSSPVVGTYNIFLGSDFEQIVLASDGSATVLVEGETMPTTYTYDSTNNTGTIDMGESLTFNYVENSNNKVLYFNLGNLYIFSTNGLTGFAPISGTYTGTHDNKEATLTFNTSGQLTGLDEDLVTSYMVINNIVYTNNGQIYFTTNDNYATLNSYYYKELEGTFTLQS